MSKRYFVVEGNNDESILLRLLPKELLKDTRIIVAGGYSAALSGIQTLFTRTNCPIYFFFDADEISSDESEDKELFARNYLKPLFNNELHFFSFKPEIEILFFYKKELLEKIFSCSISDEKWQEGKMQPKKVLIELTGNGDITTLLYKLTPEIIEQFQNNLTLKEMIEKLSFTEQLTTTA